MSASAYRPEYGVEFQTPRGPGPRLNEPPKSQSALPKAANDGQAQPPLQPATGLLVLVVDDVAEHCAYMAEVLARRGCRVRMSLSGRQAIGRLEQEKFDAVVTDVYMPDLDGIELVRLLRERWPRVKIVAVTGSGRGYPESILNFLKHLGVVTILSKPFEPHQLAEAIETLVGG